MSIFEIFSLSQKNVLVTGATGHLGMAMAWGLAEAGANVLVNSRSSENCMNLVVAIRQAGLRAENAFFDVTDEFAINTFFSNRSTQTIHCLINNAYAGSSGNIKTSEAIAYQKSYEMSVVSAHRLIQCALPSMRLAVQESGDASIINIASMYGLVSPDLRLYENPQTSNPPFYGAAKAALLQWTKYAACEFGPEKIRVNSISPGPFPSDQTQKINPEFVKKLMSKVPLGRMGKSHEIQGAILLLASSASSFINGANLSIDGGWTSW